MNRYSTFLITSLLTFFSFSLMTYIGCKKDPCEQVNCLNGGACNDGTCVCPTGYEGTFCENNTDPCQDIVCLNGGTCISGTCSCPNGYEGDSCQTLSRAKFIGEYTGNETCTIGSDSYNVTFTGNSNDKELVIGNLYNQGFALRCTVTGSTTFSFSENQQGVAVTGNGSINGNNLTIEYTLTDGVTTNTCTYVGTKL